MDRPALNDPAVFPDEPLLARQLGPARPAWDGFMTLLNAHVPVLAAEWRYYHDGKSWLCKVTRKAKTVCWVAIWEQYFTVACYLNAQAEALVRASALDQALKDGFLHPDPPAKFRSMRIEVRKKTDLEAVRELIAIKLQMK